MPGYTGIELVAKTRDARLPTHILLLSMHAEPLAFHQGQSAGAAGYVLKDSSFEELADAVRTVAGGGAYVSPAITKRIGALEAEGRTNPALSPRELEVLQLIAHGASTRAIAEHMAVSSRTVETYRKRLMKKTDANSVAELVRHAIRSGLIA